MEKSKWFLCPRCGGNLTEDVMFSAFGSGENAPASDTITCGLCEIEIDVEFEWSMELKSAHLRVAKTFEQIDGYSKQDYLSDRVERE